MLFLRGEMVSRREKEWLSLSICGHVAFECKSDFGFSKKKIIGDLDSCSFNGAEEAKPRLQRVDECKEAEEEVKTGVENYTLVARNLSYWKEDIIIKIEDILNIFKCC